MYVSPMPDMNVLQGNTAIEKWVIPVQREEKAAEGYGRLTNVI